MSEGDRRSLLWLTCAAICWRWLVAVRTPLPGVDATADIWLAERLAAGDFGALGGRWCEPLHGLLLAPALALGAPAFAAAQAVACVVGGLAVVPVGLAAERFRAGAGVPAAAVAAVAAGGVVAAGAGASSATLSAVVACGWWALAAQRRLCAGAAACVVAFAGTEQLVSPPWPPFDASRLGVGGAVLLAALMAPSARRAARFGVVVMASLLVVAALTGWWTELLVAHQPLLAVLAGVAIARWHVRVRDLALGAVALLECHSGWTLVEPPAAVAERVVARFVQRQQGAPVTDVVSTLPRVRWSVGLDPAAPAGLLPSGAASPSVGVVVLSSEQAADASLRAALASSFEVAPLPTSLQQLADEHGITALRRRVR